MWLRYKEWELLSDAQEVHCARFGNVKYYFWKKNKGICDVPVRRHVEQLLNPLDGTSVSKYEVAYEAYGIGWNDQGEQVTGPEIKSETSVPVSAVSVSMNGTHEETTTGGGRSAPRFKTVAERMAYLRSKRKKG